MGQLARSAVSALRAVSYPLSVLELRDLAHRHADLSVRAGPRRFDHPFSLVVLTAPDALRERDGLPRSGGYTIGYWPWELESFPDELGDVFAGFDEVWALSRFSAESIARAAPVPVHAVWPAVPDVTIRSVWPRDRGLDPGAYNFLFVYDLLSETDRKNPLDLIRAFRAAFRKDDRVRLTIKTMNGDIRRDELRQVAAAADGLAVTVCDRYMARGDLLGLIRSCDCYVSLHRAEGFGFTLVEAMALGKPVIATFYSANTEYMSPWNSFPVPYRMGEVRVRRGAYRPGDAWAEPDVEAAAALMRAAHGDPERARAVGERGRDDVTRQLSLAACGGRMVRRLRASAARGRAGAGARA
jgi:glycosyltransferase involved in cell wall biosynthesis